MVDWNEIFGELLTQFIRILLPVVIILCLKWLTEIWSKLKEKSPKIAEAIAIAGQLGYSAAEECFHGSKVDGNTKLDYAIDRANEYLKSLGFNIDAKIICDAIINYGVTNYKFSWTKKDIGELFQFQEQTDEDSEEEESSDDNDEGDE